MLKKYTQRKSKTVPKLAQQKKEAKRAREKKPDPESSDSESSSSDEYDEVLVSQLQKMNLKAVKSQENTAGIRRPSDRPPAPQPSNTAGIQRPSARQAEPQAPQVVAETKEPPQVAPAPQASHESESSDDTEVKQRRPKKKRRKKVVHRHYYFMSEKPKQEEKKNNKVPKTNYLNFGTYPESNPLRDRILNL